MRGVRVALVAALVVAILAYLGVLVTGGGLGRREGFAAVGPNDPVFTLFYMDGCPHCESILPEFKNWAAAGDFVKDGKRVKVRALERVEAGPLLDQKKIDGFPTFILTTADGRDLQYSGQRDVAGYKEFIVRNV